MKKIALTAIVIVILLTSAMLAYAQPTDSWSTKAPMPTARSNFGLAAVDGKLYAMGGFLGINVNTTEEYNIATNTWTTKAAMPVANYNFEVTVCEGNVYAIGGYSRVIEVYFPSNDSWIVKDWSAKRYGFGVSTVHDKIYVIGGGRSWLYPEYGYSLYNFTDVYDPATDSWTTAAPIPTPILDCLSVEVDNKIYIISDNLIQIYSPENDTWLPSIATNLTFTGYNSGTTRAASTKSPDGTSRIHFINQTAHQIYYPKTNQWSTAPPMLTYRDIFALTSFNNTLFAIGGLHADGWAGRENEMYTQDNTEAISISSPIMSPSASLSPTPSSSPSTTSATPSPSPTINPSTTSTPLLTVSPTSLPSLSIPEFPAWIILLLTASMLAGLIYLRKKTAKTN